MWSCHSAYVLAMTTEYHGLTVFLLHILLASGQILKEVF